MLGPQLLEPRGRRRRSGGLRSMRVARCRRLVVARQGVALEPQPLAVGIRLAISADRAAPEWFPCAGRPDRPGSGPSGHSGLTCRGSDDSISGRGRSLPMELATARRATVTCRIAAARTAVGRVSPRWPTRPNTGPPAVSSYNARQASGRRTARPRLSAASSVARRRGLSFGRVPASGR